MYFTSLTDANYIPPIITAERHSDLINFYIYGRKALQQIYLYKKPITNNALTEFLTDSANLSRKLKPWLIPKTEVIPMEEYL